MAEAIVLTKLCCRCGQTKPLSEFGTNNAKPDGKMPYCRSCVKGIGQLRRQDPAYLAKKKLWDKAWVGTPKGKAYRKRITSRHSKTPGVKARNAVAREVKRGRMPRAATLTCLHCGKPAEEYHHHLGYERKHWLDVIPLCESCHKVADTKASGRCTSRSPASAKLPDPTCPPNLNGQDSDR